MYHSFCESVMPAKNTFARVKKVPCHGLVKFIPAAKVHVHVYVESVEEEREWDLEFLGVLLLLLLGERIN